MRRDVHVGLQGWMVKASRKRWRKTVLPPVVLGKGGSASSVREELWCHEEPCTHVGSVWAVAEKPCTPTRAAYTLWSRFAQTSPMSVG